MGKEGLEKAMGRILAERLEERAGAYTRKVAHLTIIVNGYGFSHRLTLSDTRYPVLERESGEREAEFRKIAALARKKGFDARLRIVTESADPTE